ncbi:MAG: ArsB/NhaD family transporter [Sporolactobacillus sp.]
MDHQALLAIGLFVCAYAFIITEKVHRTIVAMLGGACMIVFGVLSQHEAIAHIDFNTLGLLIGMMIIVSITGETGVFRCLAILAAKKAGGRPPVLFIALAVMTAVGSAFFDNVTTVLLIVPVTFSMTRALGVTPAPFLMTEILMSNIGGTATMIGDPPNIMIGSAVKTFSFMDFIWNLMPVIAVIFATVTLILLFVYRKALRVPSGARARIADWDAAGEITDKPLLIKTLIVLSLTILGFFLHQSLGVEPATVALLGAFLLLLLSGEYGVERALAHVEWPTLFFFVGLFVLVGGLIATGVLAQLSRWVLELTGGESMATSLLILWLSAFASAFIDNIPFVATMIPLINDLGHMGIGNLEPLWWSLSLGACLGGNGLLIGASANLVVAGMADKEGCPLTFKHYMRIGLPVMLLSVVMATFYIYFRYYF